MLSVNRTSRRPPRVVSLGLGEGLNSTVFLTLLEPNCYSVKIAGHISIPSVEDESHNRAWEPLLARARIMRSSGRSSVTHYLPYKLTSSMAGMAESLPPTTSNSGRGGSMLWQARIPCIIPGHQYSALTCGRHLEALGRHRLRDSQKDSKEYE